MKRFSDENYLAFTEKIFDSAARDNAGRNTFLSPLSVFVLMAMLECAAAGSTRSEITHLLQLRHRISEADFADELSRFLTSARASGDTRFQDANALAVDEKFEPFIVPEFVQLLQARFDAEVFCSADIASRINHWVFEKTFGMISDILPPGARADFTLLNAVAFQADWMEPYVETCIAPDEFFTNVNGQREPAVMMYSTERTFVSADGLIGFTRPYKGGQFDFLALLPEDPAARVEHLLADGLTEKLQTIYRGGRPLKVYAKIPEFKFEFETRLNAALEQLGVRTVFTKTADLSPAITTPKGYIPGTLREAYIHDILHKAYIQVDRKGTKAAAVTAAVAYAVAAAGPERDYAKVYLDRPFLFAIMHKESGLPVFIGTVNRLSDAPDGYTAPAPAAKRARPFTRIR